MATSLSRTIVGPESAITLKQQVGAKTKPTIPKSLKAWTSPLWVVLVNKTQFDVTFVDKWFNHDASFNGESIGVGPWDVSAFGMHNNSTIIGMGWRLGGAVSFSLQLDENQKFDFSLGFENPLAGTWAANVISGHDRKAAFDKAYSDRTGGSILSGRYSGKDKNDEQQKFEISVSTTNGETMELLLSQNFL